jgi:hypothetical protein
MDPLTVRQLNRAICAAANMALIAHCGPTRSVIRRRTVALRRPALPMSYGRLEAVDARYVATTLARPTP